MESQQTHPKPARSQHGLFLPAVEVQQFLGLANYYRRFIKDFAPIAKPLHHLTEKDVKFEWTPACQEAFELLKSKLTSPPVLAHPDFQLPFILDTDASATGIGAVLSQCHSDRKEEVIAYASRTLSKPERRYCTTRRELLAVVTFVKHFHAYLLGRHFSLRTGHGSLTWLQNFKEPEGQLARWITRLQEYNFSIMHRQGKSHGNADTMSRRPCSQCGCDSHSAAVSTLPCRNTTQKCQFIFSDFNNTTDVTPEGAVTLKSKLTTVDRHDQLEDNVIGPVLRSFEDGIKLGDSTLRTLGYKSRHLHQQWDLLTVKHGKLWRRYIKPDGMTGTLQLVTPQACRQHILSELHDSPTSGHLGVEKMLSRRNDTTGPDTHVV